MLESSRIELGCRCLEYVYAEHVTAVRLHRNYASVMESLMLNERKPEAGQCKGCQSETFFARSDSHCESSSVFLPMTCWVCLGCFMLQRAQWWLWHVKRGLKKPGSLFFVFTSQKISGAVSLFRYSASPASPLCIGITWFTICAENMRVLWSPQFVKCIVKFVIISVYIGRLFDRL